MNQTIFEWLIIGISAPLAGIGVAMYLDGNIGISFIAIGTSIKFIVAYFRTPKNLFGSKDYSGSFEEFTKRLWEFRQKLDTEQPMLRWLGDFATYITFGGLILTVLELFLWFFKNFWKKDLTILSCLFIIPISRYGGVPEWLKGADCKSVGLRLRWFESIPLHQAIHRFCVM